MQRASGAVEDRSSSLASLSSLKIDWSATAAVTRPSTRWLSTGVGIVLLAVLLGWWHLDNQQNKSASQPLQHQEKHQEQQQEHHRENDRDAPATTDVRAAAESTAPFAPLSNSILDATSYIVARRQATVSAKVTGKVLEVFVEEGMQVQKGQLIARLDSQIPKAQWALAQSQQVAAKVGIEEVQIQIRQAELDYQRLDQLKRQKLASEAERDRAELSLLGLKARLESLRQAVVVAERNVDVRRQELADMEIRAPFAGIVTSKTSQPGEMISPVSSGGGFTRTGICTIVDMSSLEVQVDVSESFIHRVQPGQSVAITANAYPDVQMTGSVIAIIPTADRNKATVKVRIALQDVEEGVLPDMGVKVTFASPPSPSPL